MAFSLKSRLGHFNIGKDGGIPTNSPDPRTYFYKGLGDADCIDYLYELGIVS